MRGKPVKLATIAKKTAIVINYSYTDVFPRSTKTFKPLLKKTGHKVGGNLKLFYYQVVAEPIYFSPLPPPIPRPNPDHLVEPSGLFIYSAAAAAAL